jgi:predicted membrane protein
MLQVTRPDMLQDLIQLGLLVVLSFILGFSVAMIFVWRGRK